MLSGSTVVKGLYRSVCRPVRSAPKTGQSVIEITASLIIFTIMITLMFSLSMYLYVEHAMVTTAREGARYASLNTNIGAPATQSAGVTEVKNYTITSAKSLAGATLTNANITVTAPDPAGVTGQRSVRVDINYTFTNPVNISGFLNRLGADGSKFATIPVVATATMRYEE